MLRLPDKWESFKWTCDDAILDAGRRLEHIGLAAARLGGVAEGAEPETVQVALRTLADTIPRDVLGAVRALHELGTSLNRMRKDGELRPNVRLRPQPSFGFSDVARSSTAPLTCGKKTATPATLMAIAR